MDWFQRGDGIGYCKVDPIAQHIGMVEAKHIYQEPEQDRTLTFTGDAEIYQQEHLHLSPNKCAWIRHRRDAP